MFVTVSIKKNSLGNKDQVISIVGSAYGGPQRAPDPGLKYQASSHKPQAPSSSSNKRQASSPKLQASSSKPEATSSLMREPRNMDIEQVLEVLGPRASVMINVFFLSLIHI